ncbi:MAG TPA: hypothetical protein VGW58_08825 [Pyrinomonadaceae bacterium]|nr:hypothetical protein [Pyrinomonadaceae bacterium]
MNKTNLTVATKADASKLVKPKFGPGMLLRAEDLDLLKDYTRDLSRLMFRSLFGCGVVCGLVVRVYGDCGMVIVEVGSGLAIACSGDPIYVPKDVKFPLHDDCDEVTEGEQVWIMLCAKEKCCGPRTSICASDEEDSPVECTREKDWYEIRVVTDPPECVCSCLLDDEAAEVGNQGSGEGDTAEGEDSAAANDKVDCKCATGPCYEDHYAGLCKCHCGDCSDCECKCVLLAVAERVGDTDDWDMDHSVRRFVRPVLMRDPRVAIEKEEAASRSAASKKASKKTSKKASKKAQGQTAERYDTEFLEDEGRVTTTKKVRVRKTGLNPLS